MGYINVNLNLISCPFLRDVDQVHDMMDDIAEQQDVAKEISEAISNPVAFGQDVDEVSLELLKMSLKRTDII
jgi:hypothetical protein